ncbi:glucokinase [Lentibacillus kapialis]|uniref:Glucokinase n=1 Tax=Lentibacillus kapialis TaxID=340214 RepID=A0A917PXU3_9BACI|nr:ROK family protein [Lentibacillus kapialis]GGJ98149.1 glucokinase [Lentibacillus kapialis]
MKYAIGLDIGGTKIASGIVNQTGDIIQREVVDSDPSNRESMFSQVEACIEQLLDHSSIPMHDIYGIGAGVPGKVDLKNGIAIFQNNLPWREFPLAERIKKTFGTERVIVDNDVYMAAFAEWKEAQLLREELFVYMTVSTGISGAIIQAGEFIRGAGFAGEVGMIPVNSDFHDETLGRLEYVASGPALEKHANIAYGKSDMTAKQVFEAFYTGDPTAQSLIDDMAYALAQGIYVFSSLLDPHKMVFGGSVIFNNPKLLAMIKAKLDNWLIDEQKHILNNVEISHMGNEQGIIGAGHRILAHEFEQSAGQLINRSL